MWFFFCRLWPCRCLQLSLALRCLVLTVLACITPALAGPPSYTFSFADATTVLPAGSSAEEVLTIATTNDASRSDGVILLASGGAIYFESRQSRPLATTTSMPDAFASLGK